MRLAQLGRRREAPTISCQRDIQLVGRKMRGIGKRQSQRGRQLRPAETRSQYPHRHIGAFARNGAHRPRQSRRSGFTLEVGQHLLHIGGKAFHVARHAAQGAHGGGIGIDAPPQPQVDAAGIQRRQGAELFGHLQRRMVGQHDAAGADTDGPGGARHLPDQHGSGRTRHGWRVVMLHQPVAVITPAFRRLGQRHHLAEGVRRRAALADGRKIEDGKRDHVPQLPRPRGRRECLRRRT